MVLTNTDRDLLGRCLNRDANSWHEFVDRFLGLVLHVVRHTARLRGITVSDTDCDDLAAEVFLAFVDRDFAALRQFRGESSLATYLTVIARRVVVHHLSRNGVARPISNVEATAHYGEVAPEQRIVNREEVTRLLAGLNGSEADVVRMYHLEGKSYRDISHEVGMPENTIGPMLSRARTKMRQVHEGVAGDR